VERPQLGVYHHGDASPAISLTEKLHSSSAGARAQQPVVALRGDVLRVPDGGPDGHAAGEAHHATYGWMAH
jgi:hypothetical protein